MTMMITRPGVRPESLWLALLGVLALASCGGSSAHPGDGGGGSNPIDAGPGLGGSGAINHDSAVDTGPRGTGGAAADGALPGDAPLASDDGGLDATADSAIEHLPPYTCTAGGTGMTLSTAGLSAPVVVSAQDYPGVRRVAALMQADIGLVTAAAPQLLVDEIPSAAQIVLVGTLGKNPLIDGLVANNRLDVTGIAGRWETFVRQTVDSPFPGVDRALVIAGSDKRGTIYGMFDLSSQIGVSPWTYWADVPVQQQTEICLSPDRRTQGEPAVKYRGIFINDEAPALSGWAYARFGGFNHTFYEKVFELMSRLRANYLWPAMWGNAFNDDDAVNPQLADEYGIVMGTSHAEPMMRAQQEWARYGSGDWNFDTNAATLSTYWEGGIRRMGSYESVVTIGMRGDGDVALTTETNIDLLQRIVTAQRGILSSVTGRDPATIPQAWVLYKEVQDYYDQGMQVPDDVTLVFSDDNWGNIRKLPRADAAPRGGGYGMYYHYDYVGGPRSYKWLNTNPLPRIWEQMNLAYRHGVDRIWVVNVGDIKPMELPISFFLDLAWNPDAWPAERVAEYTRLWAQQQFGADNAAAIADILSKYTKYNARRKPELLDPNSYTLTDYREWETVAGDWARLADAAEQIGNRLPAAYVDAYYQLVLYPVKACANLNDLYATAGRNALYAAQGRAATNDLATHAEQAFNTDAALSLAYNQTIAGGKWSHMMDQTHIGYTDWQEPAANTMPAVTQIAVPSVAEMGVSIEGSPAWWPMQTAEAVLPELTPYRRLPAEYIDVFNRGTVPFDYSVDVPVSWLHVTPAQGTIDKETRLTLAVDWQQAPTGAQRVPITIHGASNSNVVVQVPIRYPEPAAPTADPTFFESDGYVAIEAEHYSAAVGAAPVVWQRVPDLGRTSSGIMPSPVTAATVTPGGTSPHLEYHVRLYTGGSVKVRVDVSPTMNFYSPDVLRYAVSFDDQPLQIANLHSDTSTPAWEKWVSANINATTTTHSVTAGDHVLKYWMVDAGVVLQRLSIDTGGTRPSYLGPPESYLGTGDPIVPPDDSGTGGAGGSGSDIGTGGATGAGGAPGTGGAPPESCPGCARLAVPFVADDTSTFFQINLAAPVDLTDAVVTFRVCVLSGTSGQILQTFVQNGAPQSYVGRFSNYILFSSIAACGTGFSEFTTTASATGTFDPTAVVSIGVKVNVPAGLFTYASPTVIYVDAITVSSGTIGPYTFDTSASPLIVNPYATPVAGSAVTWLGP